MQVNDLEQYLSKRECPENISQQTQGARVEDSMPQVQHPIIDQFLNPARENELRKLKQWFEEKEAESTYTEVQI